MARKKTIDSLIQPPGTIKGVLKRKGIKELEDAEGREIPLDIIRDDLLVKDRFVRNIAELWFDVFRRMRHLKKLLLDGGPEMYKYLNKRGHVRKDSKGGFTEYDFGKKMKVVVSYDLRYDIDKGLMEASSDHMDAFLEKKGEPALVKIVRAAFKQKNGQYDIRALNRLDQIKEDDEDFLKSLELKNKAISSTPTKLRTQLFVRNSEGEFVSMPLSISDVAKEDEEKLTDDTIEEMIALE